ncbi:16S rRNA (cytosine(967)-C(5))-methyltransferase RsmB [Evansella tamaricis]|uniref:16S rRNA (cytosine(967)-C(5))-methyltransferase n=1 Tax=Evansella tamaricis TaxID=2069301 RepID=A0ABS6JGX0_9BACI|nr:16S rRNA (cytosine(967)-C(5))-methyltransferase RsmB [Evansella tamaricis]MBU9712464.1 16S rRNA (cytosine(967)-C(5))-methyltransferase RsmB [Evansella tamaricis]
MKQGNVREAALDVLIKIEKNQAYSNLLLNETIKQSKVLEKDVPLLTELVYGTLQYKRTLDFYLSTFSKKTLNKLDLWVLILLRMSLYQMVYLDRIPDRAAIHEAVQIAKKRGHQGISGMVNGILRSIQREGLPNIDSIEDPVEKMAVGTSHPTWLISRWLDQYGSERTELMAKANLQHPTYSARVNLLKGSVVDAILSLEQDGIESKKSDQIPESIIITKGSIIGTKAFKEGWLTIQDEGSMLVAHALSPEKDQMVLDACAAPGGKSTHLSERMQNTGKIISLDIHKHKVGLIEQQANRLGLTNIHANLLDARKATENFEKESFDRILVDAPCSGLGVIQRKPDVKWTKTEEDIFRLSSIQKDILDSVWPLLKKGGRLVYSTCTVDLEENNHVITSFVSSHEDALFDRDLKDRLPESFRDCLNVDKGMIQLFPGEKGTDGFFISAVQKIN